MGAKNGEIELKIIGDKNNEFRQLQIAVADYHRKTTSSRYLTASNSVFAAQGGFFADSLIDNGISSLANLSDPKFFACALLTSAMGVAIGNSIKDMQKRQPSSIMASDFYEVLFQNRAFQSVIHGVTDMNEHRPRMQLLSEMRQEFGDEVLKIYLSLGLNHEDERKTAALQSTLQMMTISGKAVEKILEPGLLGNKETSLNEIYEQVISTARQISKASFKLLLDSKPSAPDTLSMENLSYGASGMIHRVSNSFDEARKLTLDLFEDIKEFQEPSQPAIDFAIDQIKEIADTPLDTKRDHDPVVTKNEALKLSAFYRRIEEAYPSKKGQENPEAQTMRRALTMAVLLRGKISDFDIQRERNRPIRLGWNREGQPLSPMETILNNTVVAINKAKDWGFNEFTTNNYAERRRGFNEARENYQGYERAVKSKELEQIREIEKRRGKIAVGTSIKNGLKF